MNISNQVPQHIQEFLSKIFKKIKDERLTLTEKEFVKMCEPLLR